MRLFNRILQSLPFAPGHVKQQELRMADVASLQAIVYGRVQGVFFRAFAERRANELRLSGFVRNMPDGSVEIQAEGEREKLEKLINYLREGPPNARTDDIAIRWAAYTGKLPGFKVSF